MGDEIGKGIKELRMAKGLTQAELAEKVSCGTNHISFIEIGKKIPSLQLLMELVEQLDTSFDYILLDNFHKKRRTLIECDELYKEVETLNEESRKEFFQIASMLVKSYKKIEKK